MFIRCLAILALAGGFCRAGETEGKRFYQVAQPCRLPANSPGLGDVCMRLFGSRGNEATLAAGKDFHITWGVWSYITDPKFIGQVKSLGWRFQGTLNGCTSKPEFALRDREAKPVAYAAINSFWADPNNEAYRADYLKTAKQWIDNGAESLQRDDPAFGEWNWHGKRQRIPEEALAEFHTWARGQIEAHAGRRVTMSVNSAEDRAFMKSFDYRTTEVRFDGLGPATMLDLARKARQQGMLFVITSQEDRPAEDFRRAWAGAYATGNLFVVPWDQFNVALLQDKNAQRTFIPASRLADLTAFERANGPSLDGYEDAAVGGYGVQDGRYAEPHVAIAGGSGRLTAFVRARPGDAASAVVIHLVEWGQGAAAVLKVRSELVLGEAGARVELRLPRPYDAQAHAAAEASKDYQGLISEVSLKASRQGPWMSIEVPALNPWGMVVIEKQD